MTVICEGDAPAGGFSATHGIHDCSPGFTKRERVAIAAMQGMLANPNTMMALEQKADLVAAHAVRYTDALIKELSK